MKISGNDEILKYVNDTNVKKAEEDSKNGSAPVKHQEQRDDTVVNLSQRSKEIQLAQQSMESEPGARAEKVQDITSQVQNGTYRIDYTKTGEKVVAAFVDELV